MHHTTHAGICETLVSRVRRNLNVRGFTLNVFSLTALALGFPLDKKQRERKRKAIFLQRGKGTDLGAGVRAAVGRLVPSGSLAEKCECISVFAGSLAKSANVSALLLVPSQKVRMYQRFCRFPREKCECICVFADSLAVRVLCWVIFSIQDSRHKAAQIVAFEHSRIRALEH